jgi:hypothetical protein
MVLLVVDTLERLYHDEAVFFFFVFLNYRFDWSEMLLV